MSRQHGLIVAGVLVTVLSLWDLVRCLPVSSRRNDFAHYYVTSRLWWERQNPYRVQLAPVFERWGFRYDASTPVATNPPSLMALFGLVAWLPAVGAFWVWAAIQAGALVWTLMLLGRWFSRAERFWVWVVVLSSGPVFWHFQFSQVQLLIGAMVVTAFELQRQGKPMVAAVLVTLAGTLKLYPAVLAPWFVWAEGDKRGRWTRVMACGWVAGVVVLATGWSDWMEFWRVAVPVVGEGVRVKEFNFSVPSFLLRLGLVESVGLAAAVGFLVVVIGYGWCAWCRPAMDVQLGVLIAAMVMGGLTAWGHYLVLLIFPLGVLLARRPARAGWEWWAGWGMMLWMLNSVEARTTAWLEVRPVFKGWANYLPLYGQGMLLVWLMTKKGEEKA